MRSPAKMRLLFLRWYLSSLIILMVAPFARAQQTSGNINGEIRSLNSQEPLAYANYSLEGLSQRGLSDAEGRFRIFSVPAGEVRLIVSYLGYQRDTIVVQVQPGRTTDVVVQLEEVAFSTEEVVISAQLDGQRAAIQRQINADGIVNVVSRDKIQELPDQNAAEAVGRISGVSVQRDGGEATKVVVRGLSPKYTSVTINGERIPATDAGDRSVDLSMISIDAVGGIEVYKALTPDQDGDAVGGSVNFVVKQAPNRTKANVRLQTGYNDLAGEFWQNRAAGTFSSRFLDKKIGLVLTGNYQRANRTYHELQADFESVGFTGDTVDLIFRNINAVNNLEVRQRYGGSLTLDYDLPKGFIMYSALFGGLDRDETRYRRRYRPSTSRQEYEVRDRFRRTFTFNQSISGEYDFNGWELSSRLSYSISNPQTPFSNTSRFREDGAFTRPNEDFIDSVVLAANNNLNRTTFQQGRLDTENINQRNLTAQLDLKRQFDLGWLKGYVKAGGKIRDQNRIRESGRMWTAFTAINDIIDANPDSFALNDDRRILVEPFFSDYTPDEFLPDDWGFGFGRTLDTARLNAFARTYERGFYSEDERLRLQNYTASERISAGYAMAKFIFWDKLTFLPGVRVEHTRTSYSGLVGRSFNQEGRVQIAAVDSTGGQIYTEILPMFHLKYQVKPWFDIRFAVTRSLARPNFLDLVPWQDINDINQTLRRGNPELVHTKVWNYDVFFSFYNNWGMLTLGGFVKELEDISVTRFSRVREEGDVFGYQLIEPINVSAEPATVQGIEIDLQTNLSLLPGFWGGFLIGANATLLRSTAFYPQTNVTFDPFFRPIFTDTLIVGPLPDQPNQIFNLSLGYEWKGFTGRVAYFMQTNALSAIGASSAENQINLGFNRLDITLKQKIYKGLSVFINANNLTNQRERTAVQVRLDRFGNTRDSWTRNRVYGWTADIGIRWKF